MLKVAGIVASVLGETLIMRVPTAIVLVVVAVMVAVAQAMVVSAVIAII